MTNHVMICARGNSDSGSCNAGPASMPNTIRPDSCVKAAERSVSSVVRMTYICALSPTVLPTPQTQRDTSTTHTLGASE